MVVDEGYSLTGYQCSLTRVLLRASLNDRALHTAQPLETQRGSCAVTTHATHRAHFPCEAPRCHDPSVQRGHWHRNP